jgi:hypothetical protein
MKQFSSPMPEFATFTHVAQRVFSLAARSFSGAQRFATDKVSPDTPKIEVDLGQRNRL